MEEPTIICYDPLKNRNQSISYNTPTNETTDEIIVNTDIIKDDKTILHNDYETTLINDIQSINHTLNRIESRIVQNYDMNNPFRCVLSNEIDILRNRMNEINKRIFSVPSSTDPSIVDFQQLNTSSTTTVRIRVPTVNTSFSQLADNIATISKDLAVIENHFIDFQGDFAGLPAGSLSIVDRIDNLQNNTSQICDKTEYVSTYMKHSSQILNSILSDSSYILKQAPVTKVNVQRTYEHAIEVEPIVNSITCIQKSTEPYEELCKKVPFLEGRVNELEKKQTELELLLDDTSKLLTTVKESMKTNVPQLLNLLDKL